MISNLLHQNNFGYESKEFEFQYTKDEHQKMIVTSSELRVVLSTLEKSVCAFRR